MKKCDAKQAKRTELGSKDLKNRFLTIDWNEYDGRVSMPNKTIESIKNFVYKN